MCFILHPDFPNPLIAEQDIVCFKVGFKAENNSPGQLISQFRSYIYKLGELQPKVELSLEYDSSPVPYYLLNLWGGHHTVSIKEGYHSYHPANYRVDMYDDATSKFSQFCLARCIIPKGSQYYYNPEHREYVSDQIIVQEIL